MSKFERNPGLPQKEFVFIYFLCPNPNCINPRGFRNFEGAHFEVGQQIPTSITCTSCGSPMENVGTNKPPVK